MSRTRVSFAYPKNIRFHCTKCKLCCGDTRTRTRHILLLKKEAERISKITSKPVKAFARRIKGHDSYVYEMRKTGEGKCPFLDENACGIYRSRPLICRYYPFRLRTLRNGKHVFSFTIECPGIGAGIILRKNFFERLLKRAHGQLC
jgi:Fe-S-cluster containining protein